ncbi:Crp/Fnr family transcriptional regulator [bacterium]|nr:Crp/Fnr family transcriptional regulator [candidate division CSSED10-310 bacterium]
MTEADSKRVAGLLGQAVLFQDLPMQDRERLAAACYLKTFRKHSLLFLENQRGDAAFLLVRGRVGLSRQTEEGKQVAIKTVKPGELFAEIVLSKSIEYPVTAEALTEVRCILVPRAGFRNLLNDPDFRDRFIRLLIDRQIYLTKQVQYLSSYDLEERFFRFIKDQFGSGPVIEPGLSRKDLASAIGSTPESLSRLIHRLTVDGRLSWKGRYIRLMNMPDSQYEQTDRIKQ